MTRPLQSSDATSVLGILTPRLFSVLYENGDGLAGVKPLHTQVLEVLDGISVASVEGAMSLFTPASEGSIKSEDKKKGSLDLSLSRDKRFSGLLNSELYTLLGLLTIDRDVYGRSAQWSAVLEKLQSLSVQDVLTDVISQGVPWYFQYYQNRSSTTSYPSSNNEGEVRSQYRDPSTLMRTSLIATDLKKPSHAFSSRDVSLLSLALSCDVLFMYGVHLQSSSKADASLHASHLNTSSSCSPRRSTPMVSLRVSSLQLRRLSSLVMSISDAQEGEYAIRRCGVAVTAFLLLAMDAQRSSSSNDNQTSQTAPVAGGSCPLLRSWITDEASSDVRDVLLEQQVHLHCPSHWLIVDAAPDLWRRSDTIQRVVQQEEAAASTNDDGDDDTASPPHVEPSAMQRRSSTASAAMTSSLLLEKTCATVNSVLCQTTALGGAVRNIESVFTHSFGDPWLVHTHIVRYAFAPTLERFMHISSAAFWQACTPESLLSWSRCLVGCASPSWNRNSTFDQALKYFNDIAFSPQEPQVDGSRGVDPRNSNWECMTISAWLSTIAAASQLEDGANTIPELVLRDMSVLCSLTAAQTGGDIIAKRRPAYVSSQASSVIQYIRAFALSAFDNDGISAAGALSHSSARWGVQSLSTDVATALVEWLDSMLWIAAIEIDRDGFAESSFLRKLSDVCHINLLSVFQDITMAALETRLCMNWASSSRSLRSALTQCIARHSRFLGNVVPLCGFVLCDDVIRMCGASQYEAEVSLPCVLLGKSLLRMFSFNDLSANTPAIVHTLSLFHHQSLPLTVRALVSSLWLHELRYVAGACPQEFCCALLQGGTGSNTSLPLIPLRLMDELATALLLQLFFSQSGIATYGYETTPSAMLMTLELLTTIAAAGQADAVIRHEMSWLDQSYSLLYTVLSIMFESHDVAVVQACATLIIDGLEHYRECTSTRRDEVSITTPSTVIRRSVDAAQRNALQLQILKRLADYVGGPLSVAWLLVLKGILVYDTPLWRFLFESTDTVSSTNLACSEKSIINKLLTDTVLSSVELNNGADGLTPSRDQAESLDILRRQGIHSITIVQAIEATRPCKRHTLVPPTVNASARACDVAHLAADASFVSSVSLYVASYLAEALQKHIRSTAPSSKGSGNMTSPMKSRAPTSEFSTASSSHPGTSSKRCPAIMTHVTLLDELVDRATSHMETIVKCCLQEHTIMREGADAHTLLLGDVVTKRVRFQFGDQFMFSPASEGQASAKLCEMLNRVSSCMEAIRSLLDGVEALLLCMYRDCDSSILERLMDTLSCTLTALPLCEVPHASLAWTSQRLLDTILRVTTSLSACTRWTFTALQTMPPPQAAATLIERLHQSAKVLDGVFLYHHDALSRFLESVCRLHDVVQSDTELCNAFIDVSLAGLCASLNQTQIPPNLLCSILEVIIRYGHAMTSYQAMQLVQCVWSRSLQELKGLAVLKPSHVSGSSRVTLLWRLIEVCFLECTEAATHQISVTDLINVCVMLGGISDVDSFDMTCSPAVECTWFALWRMLLRLLRALVIRLPAHAAVEWKMQLAQCLATCPRFIRALHGPGRPKAPSNVLNAAAAVEFKAVIIKSELLETEIAVQLLSGLLHGCPPGSLHDSIQMCIPSLCHGFALLRKPSTILGVVRPPGLLNNVDTREYDYVCASTVKDILLVITLFSQEYPEWLLALDASTSSTRGLGGSSDVASPRWDKWNTTSTASSSAQSLPSLPLDMLRDFIVHQFGIIKKLHRDFATSPAASLSSAISTPKTFLQTSSAVSPATRSVDGAESVADSEVSMQTDASPAALHAHTQAAKLAMELFVLSCDVRAKAGQLSGIHKDIEKLEVSVRSVLADRDMQHTEGFREFLPLLEFTRDRLERFLHSTITGKRSGV